MTEIPMILSFNKDVNAPLVTELPVTLMMQGDANAQTIRIEMTDKGQPAVLDGYDVDGYLIREDGYKVMCGGTVEGNVIEVPLNAHCYAVPGAYAAFVRLKSADAQTRRTVLRIVGRVLDEGNGPLVDTENVVPNIDELLKMLERMEEARQEAVKWAEATVTAETLAPGSEATASATEDDGKVTIHYGIPEGKKGKDGVKFELFNAHVPALGWTANDNGTFTQTVTIDEMKEIDVGYIDIDMREATATTAEALRDAWALVGSAETINGGITLTCYGEKPAIDMVLLAGVFINE